MFRTSGWRGGRGGCSWKAYSVLCDICVPSQPLPQIGIHCLFLVLGWRKGRRQLQQMKGHIHTTIVTLLRWGSPCQPFLSLFLQALVGIALYNGGLGLCWFLQWGATEEMKDPRGKYPGFSCGKEIQYELFWFLYFSPSLLKSSHYYVKSCSFKVSYNSFYMHMCMNMHV